MQSVSVMEKFMVPLSGELPMLEYLCIMPHMHNMNLLLPEAFQAPRLRHLVLFKCSCPIGSPLLSAAMGLVALSLVDIPPSTFFQPDELLHRIALMPQLEILWIAFDKFYSGHYVNLGVTDMHNATHILLPNLRYFQFGGVNAYSEAFLSRITAPCLEVVQVSFWEKRPFSVLYLNFMTSTREYRKTVVYFSSSSKSEEVPCTPRSNLSRSFWSRSFESRDVLTYNYELKKYIPLASAQAKTVNAPIR
jgi:hypothetical protein